MSGAPRSCRGFTLLEVAVALTVTAMLLVVVYNTVHLGLRAQRDVAAAIQDNDELRTFTYFLRRQLRNVDTTVEDGALRFAGDRRSLRTAVRGFRGDPSMYLLELHVVPPGRPRQLAATLRRVEGTASVAFRSRVGGNLNAVRFEYYGAPEGADTPAWHDVWPPGARPPRLVRLRYHRDERLAQNLYLSVAGADANQVAAYAGTETER